MFGGDEMTLQFILGKAGSGKTTKLIQEMKKNEAQYPNEQQILIVPDQMTYQMERFLFNETKAKGLMNIQVYSFNRVAWRVLSETGGLGRTFLTRTGTEMLLREVVKEEADRLHVFHKSAKKRGFYKELTELFKEFKQYEVEQEAFKTEIENPATKEKMLDVSLLFEKYQEKLYGKFLESEDYLKLLIDKMPSSSYIQNASVYLDGFDSFSKQELSVVEALLKQANQVKIALSLDQASLGGRNNLFSMFDFNLESYQAITQIAETASIGMEPAVYLTDFKRSTKEGLTRLEKAWSGNTFEAFEASPEGVNLHQANNRRSEIEGVAREAAKLVRTDGYRYSDMAILIRNMADYEEIVHSVMTRDAIPYFWDKKRGMARHPLIEFIRSSLEAISQNWQYEPLFQAVRTEMLFPLEESQEALRFKVDQFENYLLENGIYNRNRFLASEKWHYRKIRGLATNVGVQTDAELEMEERINEVRSMITEPLLFLEEQVARKDTGKSLAAGLFAYLEHVKAAERMELWRARAEREGFIELAREHDQAWKAVISLLDEFVEVLGEEEMTREDFLEVIQTGLEALEFSLLPPALDQLIVTDMEHARLLEAKVVFAVGLNDGVLPRRVSDKGILSEEDRAILQERGISLKPSNHRALLHEEFIAYRVFTSAKNALYLSYPAADEEGKLLAPSNYIRKIKAIFTGLQEEVYLADPSLLTEEEQKDYIEAREETLGLLTSILGMHKRGYPIMPIWWKVYNYFATQNDKGAERILSSLNYQNNTGVLAEETASGLFGKEIHASVSRMEKFFSCEFQHFARYGLRLEERATYQLEAVDMGEIFHGAMEWISAELKKRGTEWGNLTEEECLAFSEQAMDYLAPKLQHEILLSTKRMAYIKYKLFHIIARAAIVLNEQAKVSAFRPVGLEVDFGRSSQIPAMKIPLKGGHELLLQGRIDRVDEAEKDGRSFLRIIDYKSSAHDLKLPEIYYGIALQMLTYLDVVVSNAAEFIGKQAEPAGVLYFHMHNKLISADTPLDEAELLKEVKKSYKMKGLVLRDPVTITLMDEELENGGSSLIIPAEIKKDGSLSARSKTASKAEFDEMRRFVRHKYQEAGNKILDGEVAINPYNMQDRTPCQFCPFRSVCQFDPGAESEKYRYLKNEDPKTILEKMKEEGGETDETNS